MNHAGRDLAQFFTTLQELKRVRRTGWIDRGVPLADVESVADHSYLTALIAWITALDNPDLDATRVLKLAIIHDLAEAIVGDVPPYDPDEVPDRSDLEALNAFFSVRQVRSPVNSAAKKTAEATAFASMTANLPHSMRDELAALWEEYEEQVTDEARYVKEVDTLEAYLQSRHYAAGDPALPLFGFTDMADKELDHPALTALRDATRGES
jgi:putative hydrolase of HD superfamily